MEWSKSHELVRDLAISQETERRSEGEKERERGMKFMGVFIIILTQRSILWICQFKFSVIQIIP